jgi:hypothetical protein
MSALTSLEEVQEHEESGEASETTVREKGKGKALVEMTEEEKKAAAEKRRKSFERSFAGPSVGKAGKSPPCNGFS